MWFENPGAIGARNSLIAAGAELVPVPVDEQGLRVDEGLRRSPRFRLAFVTPSHQQPLGVVMSLERRFALLKAAQQARRLDHRGRLRRRILVRRERRCRR